MEIARLNAKKSIVHGHTALFTPSGRIEFGIIPHELLRPILINPHPLHVIYLTLFPAFNLQAVSGYGFPVMIKSKTRMDDFGKYKRARVLVLEVKNMRKQR